MGIEEVFTFTKDHLQNVSVGRIGLALEPEDATAECQVCCRTFLDESSLEKHVVSAHSSAGSHRPSSQEPFKCTDCERVFGYLVNLKKHRWLKHKRRRVGDLSKTASQQVHMDGPFVVKFVHK